MRVEALQDLDEAREFQSICDFKSTRTLSQLVPTQLDGCTFEGKNDDVAFLQRRYADHLTVECTLYALQVLGIAPVAAPQVDHQHALTGQRSGAGGVELLTRELVDQRHAIVAVHQNEIRRIHLRADPLCAVALYDGKPLIVLRNVEVAARDIDHLWIELDRNLPALRQMPIDPFVDRASAQAHGDHTRRLGNEQQ